jgi:serine/threonine protein kinase
LLKYFEDDYFVYLVLEYCKEGELYNYVKKKKRLPESEAKKFFKQLVDGFLYLHSKNVVHRDLKLSNILLTDSLDVVSTFGFPIVDFPQKISDFGLSTKLDDVKGEALTMCGTPNYIAPYVLTLSIPNNSHELFSECCSYTFFSEIIERRPHGLPADIWSLGGTLFF